jgi:c(7)-type cytochrome triheme protein
VKGVIFVSVVLALISLRSGRATLAASSEINAGSASEPPPSDEEVEIRLPPDLTFKRGSESPAAVLFSHTTHVAFAEGQCVACHIGLFPILHPTRRTSHSDMNGGRSCGACHNGEKAFSTTGDTCLNCHASSDDAEAADPGSPPRPDGARGPTDGLEVSLQGQTQGGTLR